MQKTNACAVQRVREYPKDHFVVEKGKLLCTLCPENAESNGKLPHLLIPGKTATLVPEFAVEDLPSAGIATLVPEFAVDDLPLAELQLWFLSLRWKTCLRQNCNLGSCACSEGPALQQKTLMMMFRVYK